MKFVIRLFVTLLLFATIDIVSRPDLVLAVSPIIKVYMTSPVPRAEDSSGIDFDGDGVTTDEGALVETDWGNTGTTLKVRIQSGGMVAGDSNDTQANVSVESDEADKFFGPILITERASGTAATDDGFIQFELILSASVTTAAAGTAPYVGTGNEFSIQVDSDDEVTIVVEPSGTPTIDVARSITIGVENTDPSVQNVTPENGDVVDDERVDITFSITDRDSGIPEPEDKPDSDGDDEYSSTAILVSDRQCTEAEIHANIANGDIASGNFSSCAGGIRLFAFTIADENDFDVITDGFDVETGMFLQENMTHFFTVVTFDAAGNFDVFDGEVDNSNTMIELTVDTVDPQLRSAFAPRTGVKWDSGDHEFDDDRQWIQVMIVDNSDLDPDSIDASDFVVEGHTVRRVQWFDVDPEEVTGGPDSGADATVAGPKDIDGRAPATCFNAAGTATSDCNVSNAQIPRPDSWFPGTDNPNLTVAVPDGNGIFIIRNSVFVQLEDDLDPDETPDINIVPDGVDDEAGNNLDSDDEEAEDWIAPRFEVLELSSPNPPDNEGNVIAGQDQQVEMIFESDENIDGDPLITATFVNEADLTDVRNTLNTHVDEIGRNRWRVEIDEPNHTGFYNIWIAGDDDEGNTGDAGSIDPAGGLADFFDGGDVDEDAIFFIGDLVSADLEVELEDSPDPAIVGGPLSFIATISNHGLNPDDNIELELSFNEPSLLFEGATEDCDLDGNDVVCQIGSLGRGEQMVVIFDFTVADEAWELIKTSVEVRDISGARIDPNEDNNEVDVFTDINGGRDLPDLSIEVEGDQDIEVGETLEYTITVDNFGIEGAENVDVEIFFDPSALIFMGHPDCEMDDLGEIECTRDDDFIGGGDGFEFTVEFDVLPGADDVIRTEFFVGGTQLDADFSNNEVVVVTEVVEPPDIEDLLEDIQESLDDVEDAIDEIREALLAHVAMKKVDLDVLVMKKDRYLIGTTEAGLPVDGELMSVFALMERGNQPPEFVTVDAESNAIPGTDGVLNVELDLRGKQRSIKIFQFMVMHDHGGGVIHYGTALIHPN